MRNKFFTCLSATTLLLFSIQSYARTIIAIDAGHGGKDPGAMSKNLGIKEKDVTLSIARELKALLDADPNFKAIMTRNSDKFIQLPERTEIARKSRANYLVSIHADSSPNSSDMKGASVWVLSNRRANDELGKWMEDHEKQSELLGGAGSVLSTTNERYLSQTVLDLQFSHSQRSGYELGKTVLRRLSNITALAKSVPQHASLSVLRSPDIPSILIETGFLSNATEEQKLSRVSYHRQIARAIYNGLVEYRSRYSGYVVPKSVFKEDTPEKAKPSTNDKSVNTNKNAQVEKTKKQDRKATNEKTSVLSETKTKKEVTVKENRNKESAKKEQTKTINPNATQHIVGQDETLYSIARMYKTTPEKLSQLNGIKDNKIVVGKKLKIR
ncbi:N-acetylmuramoyl-L-alanine amidase [Vespertiliibacter pulmonis]|uniref:N-acetylmuramoyl-L-alanine amidase n=1 Tax=Vespertiliibacter pulmonis TaxID=1443036 RepID=A0A3N4VCS1_9PAST|nr:N-acetylmuramoyl-L-alanine amidase [Vespertiliibacter pulmonis]QLB20483.1 N-acetylmuramoyl-L-alanine amidase [Vespertiliibacter pulmonis]RPE80786.1 N-acetylmuramoyl-L-alanine amidase [Vespertiliibacter pulmonis]